MDQNDMYMGGWKYSQLAQSLAFEGDLHPDIVKIVLMRLAKGPKDLTPIAAVFLLGMTIPMNTGFAAESAAKPVVGENGVISVGQDVMVTLVDGGRTALKTDEMSLVLNLDALSQDLQEFMGGKSARVVARIDCRERQISTQSMVVFDQAHAVGAGRPKAVSSSFAKPPPGSYGADILETYCAKPTTLAGTATTPATISRPSPQPPMLNVALSVPPASIAVPKAPAAPVPPPPTPSPAAAQAAPGRDHARPTSESGFVVQLVSSPSSVETDKILARLRSQLPFWPAGRNGYVASAQIRGSAYYRGRLDGFETRGQATEFCSKVVATGEHCVVFQGSPERKTN